MTKLLTDEEIRACRYNNGDASPDCRSYERNIEAAVIAKLGGTLLSGYVEKAIMEDRRKWRALIGEPVA